MELLVSTLIGILVAIVIIWITNKAVSGFSDGLGDRMESAPPPDSRRIHIEGTDALLIGVGLEAWHEPRPSIMDGAAPGSMTQWLATHATGPTPAAPGEPGPATEKELVQQQPAAAAAPMASFSGGGAFNMSGGFGAPVPTSASLGGFAAGGFSSGPMVLASPPGVAPGPSAADLQAAALTAWKTQQQKTTDEASAAAQSATISKITWYFEDDYAQAWLPTLSSAMDTAENRTKYLTLKLTSVNTSLSKTSLAQVADRKTYMDQVTALNQMKTDNWPSKATGKESKAALKMARDAAAA